jgi:hypothetical protein
MSQGVVFIVPCIIITVNFITRTILRLLSIFEKPWSLSEQKWGATRNMSILTIINTGVVILMIHLNLSGAVDPVTWFPIFTGQYERFSVDWYKNVGQAIVLTMFTNLVSLNLSNLFFGALGSVMRCCDRKCRCCNDKHTKKLTQKDYEEANMGGEFLIEYRYNTILTILFVTFMFSAGLPVLYPVAVIFFAVTYWCDKYLVLRHYRKPPAFDNFLALRTIECFKFALALHVLVGALMFGNDDILPVVKVYGHSDLGI